MDEDMDSLFDGMILITPSNQSDTLTSPPPPESSLSDSTSLNDDVSSQPLDENLFSDLTLVTPPSPSPSPTTITTPPRSLSRQLSSATRKKKRASGLRIGYGRGSPSTTTTHVDVIASDDDVGTTTAATSTWSDAAETADDVTSVDVIASATLSFTGAVAAEDDAITSTATTTTGTDDATASEDVAVYDEDDESRGDKNESPDGDRESGSKLEEAQEEEGTRSDCNDVELRFLEIKNRVTDKIDSAKEAVSAVSELRKDAIRRRRKASESLLQAAEKFRDLEKELEEACEAEDFEKADLVSQSLSSAEAEKEALLVALRNAEVECDDLESKMVGVLEEQIRVEEECASLLNNFAMDAADNADLVMKNAEALFSTEMEEWLLSSEAVDTKKIELEIESHIMNVTRSGLDNLIEDSLGDDHKEREILYKRKEDLTEELEKLLALVKEKEAEIAEANFSIEKVEKKIAGTVTGFEEVQLSVNTKYDDLQSALLQVEMDDETLTKRKNEIDAHLSQEGHRGSKIRELSRSSSDEANSYLEDVRFRKSLLQVVMRFKEAKEKLAKAEEKLSKDVQSLKNEISAARSSIQDLSSTKSSIQQEIESIKHRLIFIDKRAPELEAEKKVAASTRNFKEAARVAAEVKALSVERDEIQVKVEAMVLDLNRVEGNISSTIDKIRATEEQMELKEKELAIARFQRLTLVAGSAAAERFAALEVGDTEEADILLIEAESVNTEARKLQNVYDIKDDEIASLPKHFISSELLSKLRGKQLEGLAESAKMERL